MPGLKWHPKWLGTIAILEQLALSLHLYYQFFCTIVHVCHCDEVVAVVIVVIIICSSSMYKSFAKCSKSLIFHLTVTYLNFFINSSIPACL